MVPMKSNGNIFPEFMPRLFSINPWVNGELSDFEDFFSKTGLLSSVPSVNITDNKEDYKIELAAPGYDKEDFKIEVEDGILTISSEKKTEKEQKKDNYSRKEFSYQSFTRSFQIPENTLSDKIDANYTNGILRLIIPKKEATTTKSKKEVLIS